MVMRPISRLLLPRFALVLAMGVLGSVACNAIVGVQDLPPPPAPFDATTGHDAAPDASADAGLDAGMEARDANDGASGSDASMPVDSGDDGSVPIDSGDDVLEDTATPDATDGSPSDGSAEQDASAEDAGDASDAGDEADAAPLDAATADDAADDTDAED